jgi:hypothetical protein
MSTTSFSSLAPSGLPPTVAVPADAPQPSSARDGDAVPPSPKPSARALEIACGGGAPQPHIEFTAATNPANIARDLAAAAKSQGGAVREFTVYAVRDDRIGQPLDSAFVNGARIDGYGMKGNASLPLDKLVATVMSSGVLQRGGTLALGNIDESKLTPGLLSGLAKKHGITIAVESRGPGIDLHAPNGTVTSDPSRAIGRLHLRGGCGPGLQKSES